jgi:hypothetical protein
MLLEMLRDGRIHLSGIALLAPHLTDRNRRSLLKRATHKSKRQIEEIVAELRPRPDAPARMRKLPARWAEGARRARLDPRPGSATEVDGEHRPDDVGPGSPGHGRSGGRQHRPDDVVVPPAAEPRRPATVEPLAPARYQVRFTASKELRDKLERLQALMRSSVPDGDLGAIIETAVTEKLERLEAKRFGRTKTPRKSLAETDTAPTSRRIPAAVRRAVYEHDQGRCTYVDARGRRCTARDRLEFHHHGTPFGRGGDHSLANVRLACRTHNQQRFPEPSLGGDELGEGGSEARVRETRVGLSRSWPYDGGVMGKWALTARCASWLEERGGESSGRLDEGCERLPLRAGRQTA